MNRYGQLVLDHNRNHRPVACSQAVSNRWQQFIFV